MTIKTFNEKCTFTKNKYHLNRGNNAENPSKFCLKLTPRLPIPNFSLDEFLWSFPYNKTRQSYCRVLWQISEGFVECWTDEISRGLRRIFFHLAGINLCMRPANERRCCSVTLSFIGWAQKQDDPWLNLLYCYGSPEGCVRLDIRWENYASIDNAWVGLCVTGNPKLYDDVMIWKRFILTHRPSGFPSQKARNAQFWCVFCCQPEQVVEHTVGLWFVHTTSSLHTWYRRHDISF